MKNSISKSVLAIVFTGLVLTGIILWFGLRDHKKSEPDAPPVVAENSVPTPAPTPAPKSVPPPAKPIVAVVTDQSGSLAVIPISLTNIVDEADAACFRYDDGMKALPQGVKVYGGVEFWLQGAIHLQGLATRDDEHNNFRTSISVPLDETNFTDGKMSVSERGKNIACIYFLGGTRYGSWESGEKFADVLWHYADGTAARNEFKYNVHMRDWWRSPYEDPPQLPNALTKVAWKIPHPSHKDRSLRLYRVALVNPHPEKVIRSLEFASAMARPTLFIAALTLDPLMPGARSDNLTSEEFPDPELHGHLNLLVVDGDSHPLPNSAVTMTTRAKSNGYLNRKFTTDGTGTAQVKFDDTELDSLDVTAEHDGFSGRKMRWDLSSGDTVPASYTLKLSAEVKIGGWVVDESDSPIAGANIRLARFWSSQDDSPDKKGEQPGFSSQSTTTDVSGQWHAGGLPPTLLDHIDLDVKHPDYIGAQINVGGGEQESQLRAGTYKFRLKRGLVVWGRVVDTVGNPVSGATVYGGARYYRERQQMQSDASGKFHFSRMGAGDVEFSVIAKGYSPSVKTVPVKPGMGEIVFTLGAGKVIRALVQNEAGEPLPGTRVSLESPNGGVAESYEFEGTTDDTGHFQWDGAPDEPVHFYLYKSGYEQKRRQELKPDFDNIVTLHKTRTIQGQVVDADSGNPIAKFRIGVGRNPGTGTFYADWPGMKEYTDASGKFTLDLNEEEDTHLKAEADDYAEKIEPLPARENISTPMLLRLKTSPALHGVVVSPEGRPLAGASVTLTKKEPNSSVSLSGSKLRSYSSGPKISVTDDEGKFTLPSPPETGGYVIAVAEAGFANVAVEQVRANPIVVLQPLGRIEGILKIGGQPGVGKDLMLTLGNLGVSTDWNSYKRTTSEQGTFTFENVPPGDVSLVRLIQTSPNSWSHSDSTSVTVKPGETTQVTLGDNGALIVGNFRYGFQPTNESPLILQGYLSSAAPMPAMPKFNSPEESRAFFQTPEWQAAMKLRKNYTVEIKPDGSFTVENVVPGDYSLNINARVGGDQAWRNPPVAQGSAKISVPDSFDPAQPLNAGEVLLNPMPPPSSAPQTIWR